jgi:hypothetical protein
VDDGKRELVEQLERYYAGCGWSVRRDADGTVRASGPGGVTWIGLAVSQQDLSDPAFEGRLLELSSERMAAGQLCPLELLPASDCALELEARLERLGLSSRPHVAVYSLAA